MELNQILCPVDFSDLSGLALRYAAMLRRCGKARLTVTYAESFDPPPYFTESRLAELESQFRTTFQAAGAALRDFARRELGLEEAEHTETRVVEALPVDGILRVAEETKAGLIVLGTHGRGGVNRLMLGSVAERLLRASPVPVLTVRGDTGKTLTPPKKILCPVNNTPAARRAILAASDLAQCFGGEVIALHLPEARQERAIAELCEWLPEPARPHCRVREAGPESETAAGIIAMARELSCDLLVMGAQQRSFFDGTVLGSTTARVVRHAPCPVLTVSGEQTR